MILQGFIWKTKRQLPIKLFCVLLKIVLYIHIFKSTEIVSRLEFKKSILSLSFQFYSTVIGIVKQASQTTQVFDVSKMKVSLKIL